MSNQPDQPQPYDGTPPGYTPPGYLAPPSPPTVPPAQPSPYGQNDYGQPAYGQNPYGQVPNGAPQQGQYAQPGFAAPQFAAPTYYKGGPGYVDNTSGPRGMSLASMIVGLVSLLAGVGFFMVPQIVGIILGHIGLAKESPQGRPFSITGLITNYLALVIYGGLYAFFIIGIASMGFDSYSPSSGTDASLPVGF